MNLAMPDPSRMRQVLSDAVASWGRRVGGVCRLEFVGNRWRAVRDDRCVFTAAEPWWFLQLIGEYERRRDLPVDPPRYGCGWLLALLPLAWLL